MGGEICPKLELNPHSLYNKTPESIDSRKSFLKTSTLHKSTYSGLLLNFNSFASRCYKVGPIKCFINRA